jgi:hypothetical protein
MHHCLTHRPIAGGIAVTVGVQKLRTKRDYFLPIEVDALWAATEQAMALVPHVSSGKADKEQVARCVLEAAAQCETVDAVQLTDEACARLGVAPRSKSFH